MIFMTLSSKNNDKEIWLKPGIEVFAQITAMIAGPIIFALYLGEWLDNKYQTTNKYLLICVGIAFVITNTGLVLMTLKAKKKLAEKSESEKELEKTQNK